MPTGVQLKQFVSKALNIPQSKLAARAGSHFCEVRIRPEKTKSVHDPLVYLHRFPDAWGNGCMRIVYAGSEKLCEQTWGGNIGAYSIAMSPKQWEKFMELAEGLRYIETQVEAIEGTNW